MSMYKLLLRYLPVDEVDSFGTWAFGHSYNHEQYPGIITCWNALHKPITEIKDEDSFIQAIPKMIEIWRSK